MRAPASTPAGAEPRRTPATPRCSEPRVGERIVGREGILPVVACRIEAPAGSEARSRGRLERLRNSTTRSPLVPQEPARGGGGWLGVVGRSGTLAGRARPLAGSFRRLGGDRCRTWMRQAAACCSLDMAASDRNRALRMPACWLATGASSSLALPLALPLELSLLPSQWRRLRPASFVLVVGGKGFGGYSSGGSHMHACGALG